MIFKRENVVRKVGIPSIDSLNPTNTETATFALGCFWGPDSLFGSLPGVIRTRVGYAGGKKRNPTYHSLGDYAETIQIDYDPTHISYAKLLEIFWSNHNPGQRSWSWQYRSIVFYHNEEQKRLALETKDREEDRIKSRVFTEVVPFSKFYLAEAYHQKYYLQQVPELMKEFKIIYPATEDFIASTAAARVNGYVGGNGTFAMLQKELSSFGLSSSAQARLGSLFRARHKST